MKKTLLLLTLLLATSSLGWAGPCATGTLAVYTAPGFSCTISVGGGVDKTFSNFTYVGTAGGTAVAIAAGSVAVVPQNVGGEVGFLFSAGWNVGPGSSLDSLISYTVTAPGPRIIDAVLTMGGSGFTNDGVATVGETILGTPGGPRSLFVSASSGGTVLSDSASWTPGVMSLTVTKDVAVNGHSTGTAAVSAVSNLYSQVPEPASMLLFGSGLLALGGYIRRQGRKQA